MKTYRFKATLIQKDPRTGYKPGKTFRPKGFYYQKKDVVLVGDVYSGSTTRLSFPKDIVEIEVIDDN